MLQHAITTANSFVSVIVLKGNVKQGHNQAIKDAIKLLEEELI